MRERRGELTTEQWKVTSFLVESLEFSTLTTCDSGWVIKDGASEGGRERKREREREGGEGGRRKGGGREEGGRGRKGGRGREEGGRRGRGRGKREEERIDYTLVKGLQSFIIQSLLSYGFNPARVDFGY